MYCDYAADIIILSGMTTTDLVVGVGLPFKQVLASGKIGSGNEAGSDKTFEGHLIPMQIKPHFGIFFNLFNSS
jgi:hypothetical protein